MTFEQAMAQAVKEGAIRYYKISEGWGMAYRLNGRRVEVRGVSKVGDEWGLTTHMAGQPRKRNNDGWYPVEGMPAQVEPINIKAAKQNPGYYLGLKRQCHTCKEEKPLLAFERPEDESEDYRTWECNGCYEQRKRELGQYAGEADKHVGDYVQREAHTSRPPVEGEV